MTIGIIATTTKRQMSLALSETLRKFFIFFAMQNAKYSKLCVYKKHQMLGKV
jgi:hypothetical protein